MNDFNYYWRKIPNRQGLFMFLALTAFFLLMRAFGLAHSYWLRTLNIIVVFIFIRQAIETYRSKIKASYYEDFFDYFKIGIRTSFIGIGLFAIFFALYLDLLDVAFMEQLQQYESFGGLITPVSVSFLIFLEGMASSVVCSYAIIQIRKSRTVEGNNNQNPDIKKKAS